MPHKKRKDRDRGGHPGVEEGAEKEAPQYTERFKKSIIYGWGLDSDRGARASGLNRGNEHRKKINRGPELVLGGRASSSWPEHKVRKAPDAWEREASILKPSRKLF